MTRRPAALVLLAALACAGCDLFDDDDAVFGALQFETLELAELRVDERRAEAFRDEGAWQTFYCASKVTDDVCDPPAFDFGSETLILVAWGPGYSGCTDRTRSIRSIELTEAGVRVTVSEPTDLGACAAIVAPWQLVLTARADGPLTVVGLERR